MRRAGQRRARSDGIVAAQNVELSLVKGFGVVLHQVHQAIHQVRSRAAAQQEGEHRVLKGVAHGAVQLVAIHILAPPAKAFFIGSVIPDLAQEHGLRIEGLKLFAQKSDKIIRQFIRYIQAPARCAQRAVVRKNIGYKGHIARLALVDLGKGAEAPPAAVIIRIALEIIPGAVGGMRIGTRAAPINAFGVEIDAVVPGVGEHAVQHHPHAVARRRLDERPKIFLRAQDGVYLKVIRRVVAVVGGGEEYGVDV